MEMTSRASNEVLYSHICTWYFLYAKWLFSSNDYTSILSCENTIVNMYSDCSARRRINVEKKQCFIFLV